MSDENLVYNPDGQKFGAGKYHPPIIESKLSKLIIKISGGKLDETKANYVILAILGVIVLATIIVLASSFGGNGGVKNIPAVPNEAGQNAIPTTR